MSICVLVAIPASFVVCHRDIMIIVMHALFVISVLMGATFLLGRFARLAAEQCPSPRTVSSTSGERLSTAAPFADVLSG